MVVMTSNSVTWFTKPDTNYSYRYPCCIHAQQTSVYPDLEFSFRIVAFLIGFGVMSDVTQKTVSKKANEHNLDSP
jgi:hypothetical protein